MEISNESSVAKRQRMETQNAEQIVQEPMCLEISCQKIRMDFQEQHRIIQNLRAQLATKDKRIQELEQENWESPLMERKIKNIMDQRIQGLEQKILESPVMERKIKNIVDKRIKDLEQKNWKSPLVERKIKNIAEPKFSTNLMELPDECLLKILGYLSNFDLLRKVAVVSKKFHELSQDRHLIRKIEVNSQFWPMDQKEEYCNGFLEVLNRSLNLTFLSFDFGMDHEGSGKMFLKALPSMNHQFLKEFHLMCDSSDFDGADWPVLSLLQQQLSVTADNCYEEILEYIGKCPNLKILKFEFNPNENLEGNFLIHPYLKQIEESAITHFKLKNLQELHLNGFEINLEKEDFKKLLETFAENLPKLQRLCLTTEINNCFEGNMDEYEEICRAFASQKHIKVEIRDIPVLCDFDYGVKSTCCGQYKVHPSKELKIFSPK